MRGSWRSDHGVGGEGWGDRVRAGRVVSGSGMAIRWGSLRTGDGRLARGWLQVYIPCYHVTLGRLKGITASQKAIHFPIRTYSSLYSNPLIFMYNMYVMWVGLSTWVGSGRL